MSKLGEALSQAFTVNLATGTLTPLPDMQMARDRCGLIVYDKVAYVFGGGNEGSAFPIAPCAHTSEALSTAFNSPWERLADMNQPRWRFSPCAWKAEIYLCDALSIEIFSPESRSFRLVSIPFPQEEREACAYLWQDQLVVLSHNYTTTIRYVDGRLESESSKHALLWKTVAECLPLVWGSRVYWVNREEVVVVEAKTGEKIT